MSGRTALEQRLIGSWVLDEAHCLSKLGHDFQPDYHYIGKFIRRYSGVGIPSPVLCLTATAKPEKKGEIREYFRQTNGIELEILDGGAKRSNLDLDVSRPRPAPRWACSRIWWRATWTTKTANHRPAARHILTRLLAQVSVQRRADLLVDTTGRPHPRPPGGPDRPAWGRCRTATSTSPAMAPRPVDHPTQPGDGGPAPAMTVKFDGQKRSFGPEDYEPWTCTAASRPSKSLLWKNTPNGVSGESKTPKPWRRITSPWRSNSSPPSGCPQG